MGYLKRKSDGAITLDLPDDGVEYQTLSALRDAAGLYPLYEEVAEEDIGSANRIIVVPTAAVATASSETFSARDLPRRNGTITVVNYVANSPGITGAATNSRTLTVVQGTAPGAGTPSRTTLATLALVSGVNAPANAPSPAFTINQAAFIADAPLEVASTSVGTGLADPGGVVVVAYTPA